MKKTLCIFLISFILFIFCFNTSFASNLVSSETTISSDEYEDSTVEDSINTSDYSYYSGVSSVSTLSSYSEANLEINNILNILLIAIGVLIILLAIAILIKLKK